MYIYLFFVGGGAGLTGICMGFTRNFFFLKHEAGNNVLSKGGLRLDLVC